MLEFMPCRVPHPQGWRKEQKLEKGGVLTYHLPVPQTALVDGLLDVTPPVWRLE